MFPSENENERSWILAAHFQGTAPRVPSQLPTNPPVIPAPALSSVRSPVRRTSAPLRFQCRRRSASRNPAGLEISAGRANPNSTASSGSSHTPLAAPVAAAFPPVTAPFPAHILVRAVPRSTTHSPPAGLSPAATAQPKTDSSPGPGAPSPIPTPRPPAPAVPAIGGSNLQSPPKILPIQTPPARPPPSPLRRSDRPAATTGTTLAPAPIDSSAITVVPRFSAAPGRSPACFHPGRAPLVSLD